MSVTIVERSTNVLTLGSETMELINTVKSVLLVEVLCTNTELTRPQRYLFILQGDERRGNNNLRREPRRGGSED